MKLFLSLLLIFVSFGAPDYSKTTLDFSQNQDEPFLLAIEDVFSITGRGTVVTGKIERGTIKVGDRVDIVGLDQNMETEVTGIEMFRKLLDAAEAGDNVGMILKGVTKDDVRRGMVLAKPGSIKAYNEFEGEIVMLKKEEGGRHTPAFNRYRPQFYIRTADITGEISLLNDVQMLMPGDTALISVKLISSIGLEEGLKFAIREAGKTVGAGVVKKLLP